MKNFTRQYTTYMGMRIFRLLDDDGCYLEPFDNFAKKLVRTKSSRDTVKQYLDNVGPMLDYLQEAGALSPDLPLEDLIEITEGYYRTRHDADRIRSSVDPEQELQRRLVNSLGFHSIQISSNLTAAINLFFKTVNAAEQVEWDRAVRMGMVERTAHRESALTNPDVLAELPPQRRKAILQTQALARVTRLYPDGIPKPRGLGTTRQSHTFTGEDMTAFPLDRLLALFNAATSHRDRAFWSGLAASGGRSSEMKVLKREDIDWESRTIYFEDPNNLRRFGDETPEQRLRYKGRDVAEVLLISPIREYFFEALEKYFLHEYVPGVWHDFVFQDVRNTSGRGRPFHEITDAAVIKAFKTAALKAGAIHPKHDSGKDYTPHSLRHAYGSYLLNYFPVEGGFGLPLKYVQKLMGHSSIETTKGYALEDAIILGTKLEFADAFANQNIIGLQTLPKLIALRLRSEADRIERAHDNDQHNTERDISYEPNRPEAA